MILRIFYDNKLAQASYLVGCAKTGEALVIDPARAPLPYLESARKEGLRITHVTETHIHADFVSGSRELVAATGATVYLSDMGDADWKYGWAGEPNVQLVRDGDAWMVGNVRIQVMHTPGHTPEHIAFLLTDTAVAQRPMGLFSGDFVFVGDVGRPDLLEEAAGFVGTKEVGARLQFGSVRALKEMDDYLQIWPGHGAGSACGKALGAVPSTTVGYERLVNPALQFEEEQPFADWLLAGQPEAPRYFAQMKKVNKVGPALLKSLPPAPQSTAAELDAALARGEQVFDLRTREEFAVAHLPGVISVPANGGDYVTWMGWLVDFARPVWIILPAHDALAEVLSDLRSIGIDWIGGVVDPAVVQGRGEPMPALSSEAAARAKAEQCAMLLDVRGRTEYDDGHAADAVNIPLGYLSRRLADVPRDRPVIALCASGYRSQIAASILRAAGFANASALNEEHHSWRRRLV